MLVLPDVEENEIYELTNLVPERGKPDIGGFSFCPETGMEYVVNRSGLICCYRIFPRIRVFPHPADGNKVEMDVTHDSSASVESREDLLYCGIWVGVEFG
jgi:hypothetical protein